VAAGGSLRPLAIVIGVDGSIPFRGGSLIFSDIGNCPDMVAFPFMGNTPGTVRVLSVRAAIGGAQWLAVFSRMREFSRSLCEVVLPTVMPVGDLL
jgi:hypothetical protein